MAAETAARRSVDSAISSETDGSRESGGAEGYRIPYVERSVTQARRAENRFARRWREVVERGLAADRAARPPNGTTGGDYRPGIEGVLCGASLPGAGLALLGGVVLPVSGEVGGDAEGVRSGVGFSPTRFESHPAASPVSSTNAHSPDRSVLMAPNP
jgi:hypothetical protein